MKIMMRMTMKMTMAMAWVTLYDCCSSNFIIAY